MCKTFAVIVFLLNNIFFISYSATSIIVLIASQRSTIKIHKEYFFKYKMFVYVYTINT